MMKGWMAVGTDPGTGHILTGEKHHVKNIPDKMATKRGGDWEVVWASSKTEAILKFLEDRSPKIVVGEDVGLV